MSERNFYTPDEVKPLYGEIVPTYQVAFAGYPWEEVSKCPDQLQRCVGGLSSVAVGSTCDTCDMCPTRSAYEADELIEQFNRLGETRPTAWYTERDDEGLTLAAVAWKATPSRIAEEKYADNPGMRDWFRNRLSSPAEQLARRLGFNPKEPEIMWLDEVFANREIKPKGNLQNFGSCVMGLSGILGTKWVAYRTIEPRMVAAAQRDFGYNTSVSERNKEVPDRRDFIVMRAECPVVQDWGMA